MSTTRLQRSEEEFARAFRVVAEGTADTLEASEVAFRKVRKALDNDGAAFSVQRTGQLEGGVD